jgi:competence protein ComEC
MQSSRTPIYRGLQAEPDLRGFALVVMACAWLAGIVLDSLLLLPSFALLIGAVAAVVLVMLLWRDGTWRLMMLISLCLLLGAWRYASVSPVNDPHAISALIGAGKLAVRGSVVAEPALQGHSRVLLVEVSSESNNGGNSWQDAHGQIQAMTSGALIEDPYGANYGDNVELRGKLQTPLPYSPPGVFAVMEFPGISVDSTGGNAIIAALYHMRVMLAGIIAQSLQQPEAALLIAILLGLHTAALGPLANAFKVTGTVHLIVSSGFKVTILAGLVASGTRWLYEFPPINRGYLPPRQGATRLLPAQKREEGWRRWLATSLVIGSIAAYTVASGAGPAAVRAGIMGILLVVAPRLGRIYNIYTALGLAALLMSMFDPFVLWDVGFQLSLLGTLGIVLLTPFFQRLLHPLEHLLFGHHVGELFAVTLAAQVATLPIVASTFHEISFIAPIVNVLTVPLLGALILLGVLVCATGLLFAPLGMICGWVAWPLLWYTSNIIMWCSMLPGAYLANPEAYLGIGNLSGTVAWVYYGVLALLTGVALRRWPRQQMNGITPPPLLSRRTWRMMQFGAALLVILATGTTALAAKPDGRLTITFLSVGQVGQVAQGEAILIHTPDGKTILIDGGLDATSLGQELDKRLPFWQRSLDVVMLTTTRPDHMAGLQDIVSRYQVGEVLDAGMLHPSTGYALWRRTIAERGLHYVQVRQGATIAVGTQVILQVLSPPSPLHQGSNEVFDNALVVRLIAPGLRVLLLGATALSNFALSGLVTNIDQSYLQSDIVQVVGESSKAFPPELSTVLQAAHPALVVITPASLSPKQRKVGETTVLPASTLAFGTTSLQVVQTAQLGTLEISNSPIYRGSGNGWSMQPG